MKFTIASLPLLLILLLFSGCVSYTPNGPSLLYGYYLIKGNSMLPTLSEPTIVLVKPLPYSGIKNSDILVFRSRNTLVVHRAVKKLGGAWLTQGDGLKTRDPVRVTAATYRGTVYTDHRPGDSRGDIQGELYATDMKPATDR